MWRLKINIAVVTFLFQKTQFTIWTGVISIQTSNGTQSMDRVKYTY